MCQQRCDIRADRVRVTHQVHEHGQSFIASIRNFVSNLKCSSYLAQQARLRERDTVYVKGNFERQLEIQGIRKDILSERLDNITKRVHARSIWFGYRM
ncbi:hypothetical protein [Spartinivicinus ruber]|uniref:hypothetical protein n=1 Tax=Spartinivicinus ruber TaxID=2683272 RepID=UPI0013D0ADA6|nr:hypothetical protein [Spartinivicinus ruber]